MTIPVRPALIQKLFSNCCVQWALSVISGEIASDTEYVELAEYVADMFGMSPVKSTGGFSVSEGRAVILRSGKANILF